MLQNTAVPSLCPETRLHFQMYWTEYSVQLSQLISIKIFCESPQPITLHWCKYSCVGTLDCPCIRNCKPNTQWYLSRVTNYGVHPNMFLPNICHTPPPNHPSFLSSVERTNPVTMGFVQKTDEIKLNTQNQYLLIQITPVFSYWFSKLSFVHDLSKTGCIKHRQASWLARRRRQPLKFGTKVACRMRSKMPQVGCNTSQCSVHPVLEFVTQAVDFFFFFLAII